MKGNLRPLLAGLLGLWLSACGAPSGSDQASVRNETLQPGTTLGVLVDGGAQADGASNGGSGSANVNDAQASAVVVATPGGSVHPPQAYQGMSGARGSSFLGIRYAAAPVGALRFAPPTAPPAEAGPVSTMGFGSPCPQNASPFGTASAQEDCLFLNVYVPGSAISPIPRLPVMVFLHGGAFVDGEGSLYDPTDLAAQGDAIVVTTNYRLGILGYMANPALSALSPTRTSGNYGLEDQQFALRWVQEKIAAFGGDPANVTVFGESAGGFSVCALIASPAAAGLFQRAITESGPCSFTLPTLAAQETRGTTIASALGCTGATSAQTAECLRSVPVAQVLAEQNTFTSVLSISSLADFFPNVDGVLIPQQPATLLTLGAYNHVPVMEGTNAEEGNLFIALAYDLNQASGPLTASAYPAAVASLASSLSSSAASTLATQILNEYPLSQYASPDAAMAAVFTDAGFSCQASASNGLFSIEVPTYAYELNDPNAPMLFLPPASFPYGPTHTDELPYLFDFAGTPFTSDEQTLASTMKTYWTNFARSGNPNGPGVPNWPGSNGITNAVQSLVAPTPATESTFSTAHHCSFWSNLILQAAL